MCIKKDRNDVSINKSGDNLKNISLKMVFKKLIVVIIGLIIIFLILLTVFNQEEDVDTEIKRNPFWEGRQYMKVCKLPYDSSDECQNKVVKLTNDNTIEIELDENNIIYSYDLSCHLAATWIKDQPKYVFCRSWDSLGQQWDLMPIWAYYASYEDASNFLKVETEELMKNIDN